MSCVCVFTITAMPQLGGGGFGDQGIGGYPGAGRLGNHGGYNNYPGGSQGGKSFSLIFDHIVNQNVINAIRSRGVKK